MKNIFITFNKGRIHPNPWDGLAFILIFGVIGLLTSIALSMTAPYHLGEVLPIHLGIEYLPGYALHSVFRMFCGLLASLLFTLTVGTWAAKSKYAERILIPAIDVLQSVPVLGLLSITVVGFIQLFPNSMMGPECASIFAVFTAQAWNMTLGFYQSLKTIPGDLIEASRMFHLSPWQRFWRVDVPFAMPSLLWNTMMSMSASWFFVVASEAITVANTHITLPGIGSYIATAILQKSTHGIMLAILAMFIVIMIYDQLLFRPLVAWGEKFRAGETDDETKPSSWLLTLFQRSPMMKNIESKFNACTNLIINCQWFRKKTQTVRYDRYHHPLDILMHSAIILGLISSAIIITYLLFHYLHTPPGNITFLDLSEVLKFTFYTAIRVLITIVFCTLFLVPAGIWIGLRPRLTEIIQPIIQFLAAFPAYLLYPVFVVIIVRYDLNPNIWTTPLFLLGTLWYVLFNVIAGTSALPKDLHQVADCFELHGWVRWRRFILPGIFPYYITGAITAAGGAWNASIVAEMVSWGDKHFSAQGIGAYIAQATVNGDFKKITLGIATLCFMVIILNRVLWRPLYALAQKRYQLD